MGQFMDQRMFLSQFGGYASDNGDNGTEYETGKIQADSLQFLAGKFDLIGLSGYPTR
jgi:hypothetical protein